MNGLNSKTPHRAPKSFEISLLGLLCHRHGVVSTLILYVDDPAQALEPTRLE